MPEWFSFILNTSVALFVIVDPFAVVPVYLNLSVRFDRLERRRIRRRATLIAASVLIGFGITGIGLFDIFGITLPAFQIAGGILLLRLGIQQLSAERPRVNDEEELESQDRDDISIFPLATPLIAGPGSISTVVLYTTKADTLLLRSSLIASIALVALATYVVLTVAPLLYRFLGTTGLNLLTRLMAIILCAISVQFVLNGIEGAIQHLGLLPPGVTP